MVLMQSIINILIFIIAFISTISERPTINILEYFWGGCHRSIFCGPGLMRTLSRTDHYTLWQLNDIHRINTENSINSICLKSTKLRIDCIKALINNHNINLNEFLG